MEFKEFTRKLQTHFDEMTKDVDVLHEVAVDKDELWAVYLDSFPAGTNEIYRKRRAFDCSCCRHFIKNIGNVVVIKDNTIHSIWEFETGDDVYQKVVNALDSYVKSKAVDGMYVVNTQIVGTPKSHEDVEGTITTWEHLHLTLPNRFVDRSGRSIGDIKGVYRDSRNVFKRSLDEISVDAVETVLELISQGSLYRGEEWSAALTEFLAYKKEYSNIDDAQKSNFAWEKYRSAGQVVGKIRNHSIGTLLVDISAGMDLDAAVKRYENIVAPTNYKRPKAIFTKKMLEDAKKTIADLGYMDSLGRRYATLDDISVNNILFSNRDSAKRISGGDVFEEMSNEVRQDSKKFSKVQEISAEDFVKNVLPTATTVEALLENRHSRNLVSLTAPETAESKTMFKWNNAFGWAYSGNITDSVMRENVKMAGGKVNGVLRFSIQWNDGTDFNNNDFDAHCVLPSGEEIFYAARHDLITGGELDVDIRYPVHNRPAVENITWPSLKNMKAGKYRFYVHNYAHRGGRSGFKAEIEFDGNIYAFNYNKELRQGEKVEVATVTYNKSQGFSIVERLPSNCSSQKIWNLNTNQFIPVSVIMYSPNYWDEQTGIGNKHYFFMLKDCINPENPNGFYNEFLKPELIQHKRVFEALGSKLAVKDADDQLSGIGFSSTQRADLIVKVRGATERVLRIKF